MPHSVRIDPSSRVDNAQRIIRDDEGIKRAEELWARKSADVLKSPGVGITVMFYPGIVSEVELHNRLRAMGVIITNDYDPSEVVGVSPPFGTACGQKGQPAVTITFQLAQPLMQLTAQLNTKQRTVAFKGKARAAVKFMGMVMPFFGEPIEVSFAAPGNSRRKA